MLVEGVGWSVRRSFGHNRERMGREGGEGFSHGVRLKHDDGRKCAVVERHTERWVQSTVSSQFLARCGPSVVQSVGGPSVH